MDAGSLLKLFIVIIGIALLLISVLLLAKRRITVNFCLVWSFLALLFIIAGIILYPTDWERYISGTALILILFGGCGVFIIVGYLGICVSKLMKQTHELIIHVSLLNQENEQMRNTIFRLNDSSIKDGSEQSE